jgi:peptidoglycan hydrolase-like protein with peptidoglycan-binding domain
MSFSRGSRRLLAALAFACSVAIAAPLAVAQPQTAPPASPASPAASSASSTNAKTKKKSTRRRHHSRREPSQKAPTPDRISEIQSALARGGYYKGDPNGKWDSNTVAAMQKFQSAQGLEPTGKLDALSLQKLGLGSDVAGVSAPKPPAPPSTAQPAPSTPHPQPDPKPSQTTPQSPPAKPGSSASASTSPRLL